MIRVHATFFETRPDSVLLRELVSPESGFRLLLHKASGAYLLDSADADFDPSAFPILETRKSPENKSIKAALLIEEEAGRLEWGCYRTDDISYAIRLSEAFKTRVMIAYFDDGGSDMSVVSNCGKLERVCILGVPLDEEGDVCFEIEMLSIDTVDHRKVERLYWNDVFEREFKSIFGQDAPDLTDIDRAGFEEIDKEAAKTSRLDKVYDRHRIFINILLLPFFAAIFLWSFLKKKASLKHMLIGAALLIALLAIFISPSSKQRESAIDNPPNEQALETLCGDEISENLQDFCKKMKDIENKNSSKPE